jgi:hypothetical protein
MVDFEKAKDKIMMGPERKSMVMPEEERRNTAYHEAGHALVARLLPKTDPVHKVTVIPRGRALGVTMQLPEGDRYSMDKERMLSTISVLFGGRIAEEVFMNQMTTGASNDFERATHIARDMVTRYGMTDELGPMVYAENEGEVFLGRSVTKTTSMSEETMRKVDLVIRRIIDDQYSVARAADRETTRTRCTRWRRRCSNGKPSTPSRSTTSCPASRRARPRTGRRQPTSPAARRRRSTPTAHRPRPERFARRTDGAFKAPFSERAGACQIRTNRSRINHRRRPRPCRRRQSSTEEQRMSRQYFGTDGIRGTVGQPPDHARLHAAPGPRRGPRAAPTTRGPRC